MFLLYPIKLAVSLKEKYLDVSARDAAPEDCKSPLGGTADPNAATFNGIDFLKETGSEGAAGNFYDWVSYSVAKGDLCVTMDFVLHSTNPGAYPTPPPDYLKG